MPYYVPMDHDYTKDPVVFSKDFKVNDVDFKVNIKTEPYWATKKEEKVRKLCSISCGNTHVVGYDGFSNFDYKKSAKESAVSFFNDVNFHGGGNNPTWFRQRLPWAKRLLIVMNKASLEYKD